MTGYEILFCAGAHVSFCNTDSIPNECDDCQLRYCTEHYYNYKSHNCMKGAPLENLAIELREKKKHPIDCVTIGCIEKVRSPGGPCRHCSKVFCLIHLIKHGDTNCRPPTSQDSAKDKILSAKKSEEADDEYYEEEYEFEEEYAEDEEDYEYDEEEYADDEEDYEDEDFEEERSEELFPTIKIDKRLFAKKVHEAMSKLPLFYTVESDPEPFSAIGVSREAIQAECAAINCKEKSTLLPQQCSTCKKYFCHKHLDGHDCSESSSSLSSPETVIDCFPSKKAKEGSPEDEKIDKAKAVKWYIEKEKSKEVGMNPQGSDYEPWFHGYINREEAEDLMKPEPVGSYLVSLSDRAKGYNLTYKLPPKKLKFYVEAKKDEKYYANTENQSRSFNSLRELVEYYKQNPLRKDFEERFTHPVGQRNPTDPDYMELLEYW